MGWFSSKKVTIGYKYFLGMQQVFCQGPVDDVLRIDVDNKPIWGGKAKGGGVVDINKPMLFGGKKKGGGVAGRIYMETGSPAQIQNGYLKRMLGDDVPAFRGVMQLVFNKFYVGNSAVIKPYSVKAKRTNIKSDGSEQWYLEKSSIIANPDDRFWFEQIPCIDISAEGGLDEVYNGKHYHRVDIGKFGKNALLRVRKVPKDVNNAMYYAYSRAITGPYRSGATNQVSIFPDGDFEKEYTTPPWSASFDDYDTDLQAFIASQQMALDSGGYIFTGADSYKIGIFDGNPEDNAGGLSVAIDVYVGQVDMNPAHIIREAITEPWGLNASEQDVGNFKPAADVLFDEKLGLSFEYTQQGSVSDFIQEVCKHINAAVYVDRFTGNYTLKLIRDDYEESALPVFNNTNVLAVKNFKKPSLTELTNSVTVNFWDAAVESMGSVTVQHNALIEKMGAVNNTTITYNGCTNRELALRLCERDLGSLSKSLISCQLELNRQAYKLQVGDVFKLQLAEYGGIDAVMRITKMKLGDSKARSIIVDVTQDAFSLNDDVVYEVFESEYEDIAKPPSIARDSTVREVTLHEFYRENGLLGGQQLLLDVPDYGQLVAASAQPEGALQAILMRYDTQSMQYIESETFDFAPALTLLDPLNQGDFIAYVESIAGASVLEYPYLAQIGTELVRVDALDDNVNAVYLSRGACDTVPTYHAPGEKILLIRDYLAVDSQDYSDGDSVFAKLLAFSSLGVNDIDEAILHHITFSGRMQRPYPPGNVQLNGQYFPKQLNADVALTWAHRDRTTENGSDITDFTAGDIGPEVGTTYDVIVKDETGVELTSSLGQPGTSFAYANADERTAFNTEILDRNGVFEIAGQAVPTISNSDYVLNTIQPDYFWAFDDSPSLGGCKDEITGTVYTDVQGTRQYEQAPLVANEPPGSFSVKSGQVDFYEYGTAAGDFLNNKNFTMAYVFSLSDPDATGRVFFNYSGWGENTNDLFLFFVNNEFGLTRQLKLYLRKNNSKSEHDSATNIINDTNTHTIVMSCSGGRVKVYLDTVVVLDVADTYLAKPTSVRWSGFFDLANTSGRDLSAKFDNSFILKNHAMTVQEVQAWHDNVMQAYVPPNAGNPKRLSNPLNIELSSKRDGLASYQTHKLSPSRYGYSYKYKDLYKAR